jgi:hypothetical protein
MIHYTPEGHHIKLGLNFSGAKGGFRLLWAWYNFANQKAITYRLRVRLHMAPRIMWEVKVWSVIDAHLAEHNLVLVHREVLEDLSAIEADVMRTNEPHAYIKPYAV